jgi:hypothetical protein
MVKKKKKKKKKKKGSVSIHLSKGFHNIFPIEYKARLLLNLYIHSRLVLFGMFVYVTNPL